VIQVVEGVLDNFTLILGKAWLGKERKGKAWQGKAWYGKARQGMAWKGKAWHGMSRPIMAWKGKE